jgi:hypothetical protein
LPVFEVFRPGQQSLVITLLRTEVCFKVSFEIVGVDIGENGVITVLSLFSLLDSDLCLERFLPFKEGELLQLRPHKVGLLYFVSECEPGPSGDESTDHAGVVALPHEHFKPVLILKWDLDNALVGEVGFPNEIPVIVGFEGNVKVFIVSSHRTGLLLLWRFGRLLILSEEMQNSLSLCAVPVSIFGLEAVGIDFVL